MVFIIGPNQTFFSGCVCVVFTWAPPMVSGWYCTHHFSHTLIPNMVGYNPLPGPHYGWFYRQRCQKIICRRCSRAIHLNSSQLCLYSTKLQQMSSQGRRLSHGKEVEYHPCHPLSIHQSFWTTNVLVIGRHYLTTELQLLKSPFIKVSHSQLIVAAVHMSMQINDWCHFIMLMTQSPKTNTQTVKPVCVCARVC